MHADHDEHDLPDASATLGRTSSASLQNAHENMRRRATMDLVNLSQEGQSNTSMTIGHDFVFSPSLRRAGLLQPRSYNPPAGMSLPYGSPRSLNANEPSSSLPSHAAPKPHSQHSIRMNTMQLSNMSFPSSFSSRSPPLYFLDRAAPHSLGGAADLIFPSANSADHPLPTSSSASTSLASASPALSISDQNTEDLMDWQIPFASPPSLARTEVSPSRPSATPAPLPRVSVPIAEASQPGASGLSLLRPESQLVSDAGFRPLHSLPIEATIPSPPLSVSQTPRQQQSPFLPATSPLRVIWPDRGSVSPLPEPYPTSPSGRSTSTTASTALPQRSHALPATLPRSIPATEATPLLQPHTTAPSPVSLYESHEIPGAWPSLNARNSKQFDVHGLVRRAFENVKSEAPDAAHTALHSIPAVLLGCLLNVLDGVSYGMIIFPGTGVFEGFAVMGVSMFFMTTFISQLVYTLGGSDFPGANGSMMIEVVPFYHILAASIASQIGEENARDVIATTLVSYVLSSILTGLTFFLIGALKLGVIVGFFPRHILVGCIGGVGVFLLQTGFAVSMGFGEGDLPASWGTLKLMFGDMHYLALWIIPLALAILLRLITHKYHHQLIFPLYFMVIFAAFYFVIAFAGLRLRDLREQGWIFDVGREQHAWYQFYTYFDPKSIKFGPLWSTMPTQFALLFFNILHPPLNVPALSVSLNIDIDTNRELVGHGYSNLLAGLLGTVPNYLVYVNTLLFYRVGGTTRIAGFMLAVMNLVLLFLGTGPISYIPVMVVGALIFVLGLDLVKEALWDTRHKASRTEYVTIISIMVCMTLWDFVIGVIFGIIASCIFFVVQNSRRRSIRSLHTGETALSAVRRPSLQRAYLREVTRHTMIVRLQGFLFFGTITHVEETIRNIIEGPSWSTNPIQFLVVDLTLVFGVDMSAAEAFVRIHRFLSAKRVTLVFCGFSAESSVGKALENVHVLGSEGVELFLTFNDAIEWTENVYLSAWFMSQKPEPAITAFALPGRLESNADAHLMGSVISSPQRSYLQTVGNRIIADEIHRHPNSEFASEPLNTLIKAFSSYGDIDTDHYGPLAEYLEHLSFPEGHVLWKDGDAPDGLYIVESGVLRASYKFADHMPLIEESMVPGAVAGELSGLSGMPRNATVFVERDATVWRLSRENLIRLETEKPQLARSFLYLILKAAKVDHDILLAALASWQ